MSLAVLADHMASKGRGPDSMLIHMSPREVQGLQALAVRNGGSLTVNPDTGLPEAGFLDKLLPAILGVGASYFGISPLMAGLGIGAVEAARTGDLGKGISAGLGAYGGAGLGEGLFNAGTTALTTEGLGDYAGTLASRGLEAGSPEYAKAPSQLAVDSQKNALAAPFMDKLSAGASAVAANPSSLLTKDNFKYALSAISPVLADQAVQAGMPTTTTRPGQMRTYSYDPYGQSYTSTGNYDVPRRAETAANGGLMGMDDGGYNPGQLDFMQRSEPVVRMDNGGILGDFGTDEISQELTNPRAAYTNYTPEEIGNYFRTNQNSDIAADIIKYNADPSQVNNYIASLGNPFVSSTNTTGGSGTLDIYKQMAAHGIDPNEYYAANIANNPEYTGWSQADITRGYDLDKNAFALVGADNDGVTDKEWVNFMDTNNYSVNDMAQSFGLSVDEVQRRYDAAKVVPEVIVDDSEVIVARPETEIVLPTNPRTNAPPGTTNPYGNTNNPGDETLNPDGSTTVTPNIPGRPYGGFSGMDEVRDAYTAGGGSLGYTPYVPKTIEEFNAKYNTQTGGSKQAYDYLMGKSSYSPIPYTPTGEVMKPYAESVLGAPVNISTKKVLFDPVTRTYKTNPDYIPITYTPEGKKVYGISDREIADRLAEGTVADKTVATGGLLSLAAGGSATNDAAFRQWITTNNISIEQVARALGISVSEAKRRYGSTSGAGGATGTGAGFTGFEGFGGYGGSDPYVDSNPVWSAMDKDQRQEYYAANPVMANITALGQIAFGYTPFGKAQSMFAPDFVKEQRETTERKEPADVFEFRDGQFVKVEDAPFASFSKGVQGSTTEAEYVDPQGPVSNVSSRSFSGLQSDYDPGRDTGISGGSGPSQGVEGGGGYDPGTDTGISGGSSPSQGPDGDSSSAGNGPGDGPQDARGGFYHNGKFDQRPQGMAYGGIAALAQGGAFNLGDYSDGGRLLRGPGNGTSDDIPATIGNKRPARLADGEFVIPSRIVSELGNGSTEAGARQLYAMMDRIQAARRKTVGKNKVAFDAKARKHLPA